MGRTFSARLEQHAAPFSQHCTLLSFPVCGCSFHSLYPCKTAAVAAINELLSADRCCCGLGQFADYPGHKGCSWHMGFETWEAFVSAKDNRSSNLGTTFIEQRLAGLFCAANTAILFLTCVTSTHVRLYIPAPGYREQQGHTPVIKEQSVIALWVMTNKRGN